MRAATTAGRSTKLSTPMPASPASLPNGIPRPSAKPVPSSSQVRFKFCISGMEVHGPEIGTNVLWRRAQR